MRNGNLIFLFLHQKICCGYSKEPSQFDGSFEHPKHMLKLMGKKHVQFYAEKLFLSKLVTRWTSTDDKIACHTKCPYIFFGIWKLTPQNGRWCLLKYSDTDPRGRGFLNLTLYVGLDPASVYPKNQPYLNFSDPKKYSHSVGFYSANSEVPHERSHSVLPPHLGLHF